MNDVIFQRFVEHQAAEATRLSEHSDLVTLTPCQDGTETPTRWVVELGCQGIVKESDGAIVKEIGFLIGIWFPSDYLRRVDPADIVTWLGPTNVWHPNILGEVGAMCLGRIDPGTGLVDLVHRCYEIISYHNFASHDALNQEAAQWARNNQEQFPLDNRPLKWRQPR